MFRRPLSSYGIVALAAAVLVLATPRAAHAIAAVLVQVTNTVSNPAIAQDVSKLASQNVQLISNPTSAYGGPEAGAVLPHGHAVLYQMFPDGAYGASPFVVPAGQSLVITSLDLGNVGDYASVALGNLSSSALREQFAVSADTVFPFPSGLVFPAGESVVVQNYGASLSGVIFTVHGYLTTN